MLLLLILVVLLPFSVQADVLFVEQMALAKKGNAEAQLKVGEMYEVGFGVRQNKREAIYWITRSANQGHEKAGFKLLYLNVEKKGLKGKNKAKMEALNSKAKQGNSQAQYYLGKMYAHGVGINKNSEKAISWLNKAASVGVFEAELELASVKEEEQRQVKKEKRFESDLCSGKSARFLSTCK